MLYWNFLLKQAVNLNEKWLLRFAVCARKKQKKPHKNLSSSSSSRIPELRLLKFTFSVPTWVSSRFLGVLPKTIQKGGLLLFNHLVIWLFMTSWTLTHQILLLSTASLSPFRFIATVMVFIHLSFCQVSPSWAPSPVIHGFSLYVQNSSASISLSVLPRSSLVVFPEWNFWFVCSSFHSRDSQLSLRLWHS